LLQSAEQAHRFNRSKTDQSIAALLLLLLNNIYVRKPRSGMVELPHVPKCDVTKVEYSFILNIPD